MSRGIFEQASDWGTSISAAILGALSALQLFNQLRDDLEDVADHARSAIWKIGSSGDPGGGVQEGKESLAVLLDFFENFLVVREAPGFAVGIDDLIVDRDFEDSSVPFF